MKLADVSIKRPVFTTMIVAAILVLGLFSFLRLNVDMYPNVDIPYVSITTVLPGSGPAQIETDVTKQIEDAVNPIEGVEHIFSTSQEGVSIVVIQFKLEIDSKVAAQEVREKVAAIRSELPDDTEDPVIKRYDPADQPILTLTVGGNRTDREITEYTKNVIKKRLENIPGVGSVELIGGAEREILIQVDAEKLRAYNLSIQDVIFRVGAANVEIPGGNLNQGSRQLLLRTMGKITEVKDFRNIVVATPKGEVVYLSDIAVVLDTTEERTSLTRLNGVNAVGLDIKKQSGSNTVQVADGIKKELVKLSKEVPADIKITLARDNSEFIKHSINDVLFDLIYGAILAVFVIYLFLANIRATLISAMALPTSIIGSFVLMYALGFTLNVMTLLALSLAVGLLIDDAIVVIENIYRHMHEGETPLEAARSASDEIGLAVMAVTLSLVAVFVPVAFMPGIVGRFFFQFGITVTVAVLVSLFIAFSLTPMLSSRWLAEGDESEEGLSKEGNIWHKVLYYFNHFFYWMSKKYVRALKWSLAHRLIVVVSAILIFIFSFYLMGFIGSEFFPQQDQGEFYITINAAPGFSLEQTDKITKIVEEKVSKNPDVINILTTIGSGTNPVNQGQILVKLNKKSERDYTVYDYMKELRSEMSIPGANISIMPPGGPGGNQKLVMFSVRGEDLKLLEEIADKVESIIKTTPGAVDVESSLETSKPEVRITVEREKASQLGISPGSIATTVRSMVDGVDVTKYQEGDEQYDVRVRLREADRSTILDVSNITIKSDNKNSAGGTILIPLSDVAFIERGVGPSKINRYDRQREIRIDANLQNRFLGEVLGDAMTKISTVDLPEGYSVKITGSGEMQSESFLNIFISLALAIIFVYIVLAAQFESFVYPFSIMLALPMAIIGAVIALLIFHSSISVMSLIGIIMLMGLVSKNGILLVDYINIQRDRGQSRTEAILIAGPTRLRPILMTTFAMIFGMIPVAFSFGEGSEFRSPMGQAVIGGLVTSTLLTLFIVPVVYTILDDISLKKVFIKVTGLFRKKKQQVLEIKPGEVK
jgi:hydrophobe/amphiphile efflux-1 (HAE1) family protein